jgi:uncharacterized protein YjbI with pentapeptide repeats
MKAKEVLRRYAAGERDFRRANLRGQSFKGKDLSGADFSEADIRSANFTGAVLRGVNFAKAKAGLQKRWIVIQLILSLIVSLLSGVLPGFAGAYAAIFLPPQGIDEYTIVLGAIILVVLAVSFVAIVRLAVSFVTPAREGYTAQTFGAIAGVVAGAVAGVVAGAIAGVVAGAIAGAGVVAGAVAGVVAALSIYVAWRTSKGNEKFTLVRTFGVAFGAIGGTSFRGADLTAANFTGTTLKSTRLMQATLTHACWSNAQKLDRARVGDSLLANAAVRELLTSRNGYRKSYVDANLRGANLTGVNLNEANLKQADLSNALLQDADLRGANLSETLAVGADFTGAALTGACLQAWNIDHTTKLDQVDCQFVFLLEQPNSLGSRERRPHDSNKVFEPGDFAKLYQKIMTTVQLLLRDGIHPEAFKAAFERLMQENPDITPDAIQAVERKGNDVLVTLTVPDNADKGKIEREWDEVYQARLEAQKSAALLEAANNHKEDIKEITLAYAANLSGLLSNFTVNAVSESKAMSDSNNPNISAGSGSFVNAGNLEMTGSTVNLGEISGNVTNTINQLQQSSNPEAAQLADLLKQLQSTIEAEPALTPEDKTEALEQVGTLAKAGQNPQDGTLKKLAATAIKILKGTIASLPSATQTVTEVTKLVGAIATLLAL